MRFRDHLSDLPKEIPGGQKAPEVYDKSRLLKLEEEARRLREMIDKKEDEKRHKLREWDSLERDANTAQIRVELAETSLRELDGEGDVSSVDHVGKFCVRLARLRALETACIEIVGWDSRSAWNRALMGWLFDISCGIW
jgi:hypothetical protein